MPDGIQNFLPIILALSVLLNLYQLVLLARHLKQIRSIRGDLDLTSKFADEFEALANKHAREEQAANSKLAKQLARVEPLQYKLDGLKEGLREAESQLVESQRNEAALIRELESSSKQLDRSIATNKQLVSVHDNIIAAIDPSGTLAEEVGK